MMEGRSSIDYIDTIVHLQKIECSLSRERQKNNQKSAKKIWKYNLFFDNNKKYAINKP